MESVELGIEPHHMGFETIETRINLLLSCIDPVEPGIDPVEPGIEPFNQSGEVGFRR
jgi:hypothetical protein